MALTGNIADWSLADLLQIVGAERKSGTLTLFSDTERVTLQFHEGKIVGADHRSQAATDKRAGRVRKRSGSHPTGPELDRGILAFLIENGKISETQGGAIRKLVGETGDEELAALQRAGLLAHKVLEAAMGEYMQDLIYRVLTWEAGEYNFATEKPSLTDPTPPFAFNTEAFLLEGMRRIDESRGGRLRRSRRLSAQSDRWHERCEQTGAEGQAHRVRSLRDPVQSARRRPGRGALRRRARLRPRPEPE
jgi:hypothetical protein